MHDRPDGELTPAEEIANHWELASQAEHVGRMEHYSAGVLYSEDDAYIEWFRLQPDHIDGPGHSGSFEEYVAGARQWYAEAERHYLHAASLHHGRDALPRASAEQMIRQLPSPLREELTVLRDDFRRAHDASATPTDQLDRFADYLSNLSERVGASLGHQRDNGNDRSR